MMSDEYLTFTNSDNAWTALTIINDNYATQYGGHAHYWLHEPEKSPERDFWFFPKPKNHALLVGVIAANIPLNTEKFNEDWRKPNPTKEN